MKLFAFSDPKIRFNTVVHPLAALVLFFFFISTIVSEANAQIALNEVKAESQKNQAGLFDYLQSEKPLEVTIQSDWGRLLATDSVHYQDATFLIHGGRHQPDLQWDIALKARGKYRRRVCDFPPLKLKFSSGALERMGLESKHNKLKLVTHCLDDKFESKENVLREYLAYELYQTVSPHALRVQLLHITYRDANGRKVAQRYGFVIEDIDELADRIGARELNVMNPHPESVIKEREARMAMFQYMIGNEDWSLEQMRNLKLLQDKATEKCFPVPYDFDFSGLVNPAYAVPRADIGELSISQRTYLGWDMSNKALQDAVITFLMAEQQIMDQVRGFKLLSPASREDMELYLQPFFQEIRRTRHHPDTDIIDQVQRPTWKSVRKDTAPAAPSFK